MSETTSTTVGGSAGAMGAVASAGAASTTAGKLSAAEATGIEKEMSELRKEVIESRNLVIKTDNLLKNLHAELKLATRKQEQFEKRHLVTSATAFIIFAVLATVGAYSYARGEIHSVRTESSSNEAQAKARGQEVERLQKVEAARREASERALRIFDVMAAGKEGPELNDALVEAAKIDRGSLSALESKALTDKESSLREKVALASQERGRLAFRRQDFATAEKEYARFVELMPNSPDAPFANFYLGESRSQLKKYPAAIGPLETFLKTSATPKNHDWASVLLGIAYEESGNFAKAQEVYANALQRFPASIHATQMRNHMKRLPQAQAAAEAKKGTAALPPKP